MRRLLALVAAVLSGIAAFAYEPSIPDIDITVALSQDGTASVTEVWDIVAGEGTEWYLVRNNLGDIVIGNLSVTDETGRRFINEGSWDVNRSLDAKAGRCGLNRTGSGIEICWGLGSYGPHTYTVKYTMTNAVKSLNDADMLHLQLVSPGLSSRPQHVKVTVRDVPGDTRFWGFGFNGQSSREGDDIVFESTEKFVRKSSVIVLLRFPKGTYDSPSIQARGFEEVLAGALEGAKFEDEGEDGGELFGALISLIFTLAGLFVVVGGIWNAAGSKKRILGVKPKDVSWNRDVPYGGNLEQSNYTLKRLGEVKKGNSYASALILRMVYDGVIVVSGQDGKKVDLAFDDSRAGTLGPESRKLYDMMKAAAGSDSILQDKEFSRWSKKNYRTVNDWISSVDRAGRNGLLESYQMKGTKYTPAGQEEARKLLGFKKFLSDFTLVKERSSREVGLWQDYLVFASLFGIADQVAKELHDIDPQFFEQAVAMDYNTMNWIILRNYSMSSAITNAQTRAAEAMGRSSGSFGGFGGGTSFGGGGGFSGGGFGGGAR